ncbi:hypothetical protein [Flavobacterium sp. LM4]|uniref:hypothetical protein n=1 Tax=Flavobacterium sp. LM4 TaxID=1938609 RepID=UPI000994032B|nr:hypothetical protein [Flavobacterium sp. LM4]OOV19231.1 hypothetical protein BXU10_06060 [Flavobacterium sp. LM4]
MIKKLTFLAIIILSFCVNAQKSLISDFQKADILLKTNNIDSAYFKFKILEQTIPKTDTLYKYSLWYYTLTTSQLEYENRLNEKFDKSLKLGIEALAAIEKGIPLFDAEFAKRKYFMIKNIVVSNFGLGDFNEGKKWKEKLYQAKEKKELPEGLDESFNFDFFRFENKKFGLTNGFIHYQKTDLAVRLQKWYITFTAQTKMVTTKTSFIDSMF